MQELHAAPHAGTSVLVRGHRWSVTDSRPFRACALVTLEGREAANAGCSLTVVVPADHILVRSHRRLRRRSRRALARAMLDGLACVRPDNGVWATTAPGLQPCAWQVLPALAVLDGATRVLLADGVGLGKTVQAGLILAELQQRGLVERALILTPPALRGMWRDELARWFGIAACVVDRAVLATLAAGTAARANPWAAAPVVVSSIDLVKRPDTRAAVEAEPVDLLIVDEAHHLTADSDRGVAAARLAAQTPWVVLASATPHAGDEAAFRWLLGLGAVSATEAPMQVFRRSRADAGLVRPRRMLRLEVRPTPAEQALHAAVLRYARRIRAASNDAAVRLLASLLARRAASSAWACEATLTRRLEALTARNAGAGAIVGDTPTQVPLPWEELEASDTATPGLACPALPSRDGERAELSSLIALARRAGAEPSKFRSLQRLMSRTSGPLVVFTEFRDSLEACRRWLGPGTPVACLHGGLDVPARAAELRRFLGGAARVLLCTDVAGEGLNLQSRARVVVTLEWPWNPQRLEQRVGRVDRLGQARRVHAIHLTSRETFEQSVVSRLLARAARAEHDLSAGRTVETAVESALFGNSTRATRSANPGVPRPAGRPPQTGTTAAAHAVGVGSASARPRSSRCGWALPAPGGPATRVIAIFDASVRSDQGRLLARAPVAVEVSLAEAPATPAAWVRLCRDLAADAAVHAAARAAAPRIDPGRWQPVRERLVTIRAAVRSRRRSPIQPSMFEARAHREADRLDLARQRLTARLSRLLAWLAGDPTSVELEPLAVLPLRPESGR